MRQSEFDNTRDDVCGAIRNSRPNQTPSGKDLAQRRLDLAAAISVAIILLRLGGQSKLAAAAGSPSGAICSSSAPAAWARAGWPVRSGTRLAGKTCPSLIPVCRGLLIWRLPMAKRSAIGLLARLRPDREVLLKAQGVLAQGLRADQVRARRRHRRVLQIPDLGRMRDILPQLRIWRWRSKISGSTAAARSAVHTRFTTLSHHVNAEALERAFWRRKRHASMEVNGMAVTDYEQNLEASLQDLTTPVQGSP